ncbi:DUF4365 domain-containing protein [Chitinophaga sp. 22321]|uniref:DUF4365 domain-containing protein n=1 Tax=Chitinophaga hostae TaxID=2831022 RepID=A0ABS5JBU3_9BACT|nr:DUF4365 domain-containing protein [Chitinophaga hostae]MBS0032072.1 DUF4365 domain-containing protein [Chitinophaga hostae]
MHKLPKAKGSLGLPAPYSPTTASEMNSMSKLKDMLNKHFVKPDLKEQDKLPGIDGYLEMTDEAQYPNGKLEVQVKTLKKTSPPRYQCDLPFLAYCQQAILPVLLIAVDVEKEIAYWLHISQTFLLEVENKLKDGQKTVMLSFPSQNIICYNSHSYIYDWRAIIDEYRSFSRYPSERALRMQYEQEVMVWRKKMKPAIRFSSNQITQLNRFVEHFNLVLRTEFPYTKSHSIYNFFKIGIAVSMFTDREVRYLMYPLYAIDNEVAIKEIDEDESGFWSDDSFRINKALFLMSCSYDSFTKESYVYKILKKDVISSAETFAEPVENFNLAREYLGGFVLEFYQVFGFDRNIDDLSFGHIAHILNDLIPIIVKMNPEKKDDFSDEGCMDFLFFEKLESIRQMLTAAQNIFDQGNSYLNAIPIYSKAFDLKLVKYYLDFLIRHNTDIGKCYRHLVPYSHLDSLKHDWREWKKNEIVHNLEIISKEFLRIYENTTSTFFPVKGGATMYMQPYQTSLWVLMFNESTEEEPYLLVYILEGMCNPYQRLYFFDSQDPACPTNDLENPLFNPGQVTINGNIYRPVKKQMVDLDFLFEPSPTYTLIREFLTDRLKEFFKKMDV